MKENPKRRNPGNLGKFGSLKVNGIRYSAYTTTYLPFIEALHLSCIPFSRFSELFVKKSQIFPTPHVFWPPFAVTPLKFYQSLSRQKTIVHWPLCLVVCVIICYSHFDGTPTHDARTPRRTDGRTQRRRYMTYTVLWEIVAIVGLRSFLNATEDASS